MTQTSRIVTTLGRTPHTPLWVALAAATWFLGVLLPRLYRGVLLTPSGIPLSLLAPLVLIVGTLLFERRRRQSEGLLLAGFPAAVAAGMCGIEHDLAMATYSPWLMGVTVLCLGAYEAVALEAASRGVRHRHVEEKALGEVAPVEPERRKKRMGTVVLVCVVISALLTTVFGSFASPAHYRERWGDAAEAGALLTALVSGLVGAGALVVVAPGLRADRGEPQPEEVRRRRLIWLLVVAASGLSVYALFYLSH
jgi:hypothetical protein